MKYVSAAKNYAVDFLNGIGEVFDALAGLAPEPWSKIFGLVVTVAATFGVYHFKDPGAVVQGLTAFVLAIAAVGVAGKELLSALKPADAAPAKK